MTTTYERYIATTKYWLYSYNRMQKNVEVLRRERETIIRECDNCSDVNAPIAKYGTQPVRCGGRTSPVESAAARHERTRIYFENIDKDISINEDIISRVNKAYGGISEFEQGLIRQHYFEHIGWDKVAEACDRSRKWVTDKGNDTVRKMALLIFGDEPLLDKFADFVA